MANEEAKTTAETVAASIRGERAGDDSPPASPKRGRGRPKGSKTTKPRTAAAPKSDEKAEREPYKKTAEGVASSALLVGTLWTILGPVVKLDALTEDEATQLGAAVDPILHKYVPMLDTWREEINLAVALVGAYEVTRKRYREEHPEEFIPRPRYRDDRESDRDFRDAPLTVVE